MENHEHQANVIFRNRALSLLFNKTFPGKKATVILLVFLVTLHFILGYTSLTKKSVTIDEFAHLPAGYSYLTTGSFILYPHNPPLIKMLAAIPLLFSKTSFHVEPDWSAEDHWWAAYIFEQENRAHYIHLFRLSRCVILFMSCLCVVVLYLLGNKLFGRKAGLAAAFLYALSPNILAHARLVTPDVGSVLFSVLAFYLALLYLEKPSWPRLLLAGTGLGLAVTAKFSALTLYPILLVIFLIHPPAGDRKMLPRLARQSGRWLLVCFISVLVINGCYLAEGTGTPLGEYHFASAFLSPLNHGALSRLPVPLPFYFLKGFDLQKVDAEWGYPAYLLGKFSPSGWWYYYLFAMLVKIPLPFFALILGVILTSTLCRPAPGRPYLYALVPVLIIIPAFSFLTHIDIGIRYILLAMPFLFVLAGSFFADAGCGRIRCAIGIILLVLYAGSQTVHPDYIPYFNFLAGGPGKGIHLLGDSNIDWGQDLPGLKRYLEENNIESIHFTYFGRVDPGIYGIPYRPLLDKKLPPGYTAISANFIQGRPYDIRVGPRAVPVPFYQYRYLMHSKPEAIIGHSIYIFKR